MTRPPIELSDESLPILVTIIDDELGESPGGAMGIFSRLEVPEIRQIPIATVRDHLQYLVDELGSLFHKIAATERAISLKEIEISFEITASGKIAIIGSSAQAAGSGAITLRFERRD